MSPTPRSAAAADLLPGVAVDKPTAVARSCDVLLLTVPDDMLHNVVTQLAASGFPAPGSTSCTPAAAAASGCSGRRPGSVPGRWLCTRR